MNKKNTYLLNCFFFFFFFFFYFLYYFFFNIKISKGTENGYYLTDGAESGTKIQSEGSEGYLFQCTGSNGVTCVAVPQASLKIGYYLYANESNKYIKCTDYGHCSVVDVKTSATGCNDVNGSDPKYSVGDIINNGTNDVLCLDISVATGIIIGTQASYFADKNSIFHSKDDEYVLINATTDHTVVLSDKGILLIE